MSEAILRPLVPVSPFGDFSWTDIGFSSPGQTRARLEGRHSVTGHPWTIVRNGNSLLIMEHHPNGERLQVVHYGRDVRYTGDGTRVEWSLFSAPQVDAGPLANLPASFPAGDLDSFGVFNTNTGAVAEIAARLVNWRYEPFSGYDNPTSVIPDC